MILLAKHTHKHTHTSKHEPGVSSASTSPGEEEKEGKEEIKVDLKKVKNLFSNKSLFNKYTLITILVLVGIFFSVYFRAYPATLPITGDWARNAAYNSIRSNIAAQINQQYPNLPATNKNQLIDQQVELVFEQQKVQIEQQIDANDNYFKRMLQDDQGQTYLKAIDPYQHLRRADNLMKNGHLGDTLVGGMPYSTLQFAPIGKPIPSLLHPYVIFYLYRFLGIFNSSITMLAAAFWVPVLISALSVIPAFFIARRRAGLFGGFIAGLIVAIHPVFLGRTAAGFSDTDAYVVFFALLVAWLFIEGFETSDLKKKIILTVLAGFSVGVFAFAWVGWWYVFDLLVGLLIIYIGYRLFKLVINKVSFKKIVSDPDIRGALIVLVIFVVISALFVSLFSVYSVSSAVTGPFARTKIKNAAHTDFWPNIQTTVAELNPVSVTGAIRQLGGKLLFFIAAIGIVLSLIKVDELKKRDFAFIGLSFIYFLILLSNSLLGLEPITYLALLAIPIIVGFILLLKDDRNIDIKYAIMLMLWFIGTIYASTKGTRFVLLMVPAFGVAMGIALGLAHRLLTKVISQEFKIKKIFVSIGLIILLSLFLLSPVRSAHFTAKNEVPSMNDAWWETLTEIKLNSSEDAIINSWWDFGHWFKYVADRPVTVDGAGQDYQLAHWMGTILIANDEEKAVNTLRMLDCGSRKTYLTLLNDTDDILLSVNLTKTIIMQSEEEARETLEDAGVSPEGVEQTIGYSFCEPPENFLITSEDMVGKAGVWGHFGSWNFNRAFIYMTSKGERADVAIPVIMDELGFSEDEATDYYYQVQALSSEEEANAWIAPWPNYLTGKWTGCRIIGEEGDEGTEDNSTNTTKPTPDNTGNSGKGLMVCNINKRIQGGGNQGELILERAILDLDDYKNSSMVIGAYDPNTGYRTGEGKSIPSAFVLLGEDEIERVEMEETTLPYDVLIDMVNSRVLVTDPRLSESLFTKLFFLDGRYTTRFEKVSDLSTVNGQRITVWKVKW